MALSPMMVEYRRCKEENPDCLLFYRVGDFYELFFEDAKTGARELELTLTGKECGLPERAPMCGVPHHAVDVYIDRLVQKGYKVAICEQVEDPKEAKGLVKREVVRIVTPGTNTSESSLSADRNRYIVCVIRMEKDYGIASADLSTGEFAATQVEGTDAMMNELIRLFPSEILCNEAVLLEGFPAKEMRAKYGIMTQTLDDWYFKEDASAQVICSHFGVQSLAGLGLINGTTLTLSAGALLRYLVETQKSSLSQITSIRPYSTSSFMLLDAATMRNLELTETMKERRKTGSLFGVLDRTRTAMGARYLRRAIECPLIDRDAIEERLDAVEALTQNLITLAELREYLSAVYDLERLGGRVASGNANARDLIALKTSAAVLPAIAQQIAGLPGSAFEKMSADLDPLTDIRDLIEEAIVDDPPLSVREGGIIKEGYCAEADEYRNARRDGTSWLTQLEEEEKKKTGIPLLRVKYSRVFGYCIEVTNSFKDKVPDRYTRRQTLTGAERFITPELKELEDKILGAQDKLYTLEYSLFTQVREQIAGQMERLKETAECVARIDMFCSLADAAMRYGYTRPEITTDSGIEIRDGRHPVVERMMEDGQFIPNDMTLDAAKDRIAVITGPNMAGKSTYMRQNALLVLMAQIGSFIPAAKARIGIVDRIFTRVGASDDLSQGQSTFMVEMSEVANILRNATPRSLLILDEIGRGTSTFDGLSIAWAVIEYIADPKILGAKTLFATHYHELTELEGKIEGVRNFCIAVKERGDKIVFLRKIVRGGADKSYGIQVALLAGVPRAVLDRAKELSAQLSKSDITETIRDAAEKDKAPQPQQLSFFDAFAHEDILEELDSLSLDAMTPLEAMNALSRLQTKYREKK